MVVWHTNLCLLTFKSYLLVRSWSCSYIETFVWLRWSSLMLQGLQLWLPISKSVDEPIHAWPDIFNSGEAARLYIWSICSSICSEAICIYFLVYLPWSTIYLLIIHLPLIYHMSCDLHIHTYIYTVYHLKNNQGFPTIPEVFLPILKVWVRYRLGTG